MTVDFDFSKYQPTEADLYAIGHLVNLSPNLEHPEPKPDRFEITGDVYEGEPTLDPNKTKRENDEDKRDEPTKH